MTLITAAWTRLLCMSLLLLYGLEVQAETTTTRSDPAASGTTKDLEDLVLKLGGQLNARGAVGAHGRRGLFTTRAVAKDKDILVIPEAIIMNLGSTTGSILTPILSYLREQTSPCSRFKAYIDAMRPRDAVMNACSIPMDHVKLLNSTFWEDHVSMWQSFLLKAWSNGMRQELEFTFEDMLGDQKVTMEQVQQACAVVTSRYVKNDRSRLVMAPIFDLANHRDNCTTYLESNEDGALRLVAGEELKDGEEVCYSYGTMRDDHAAFYYGYVPALEGPPRLLTVDHPLFSGKDGDYELPGALFTGSLPEIQAEVERLTSILKPLELLPAVPRQPASDTDENYSLNMMLELRERRVLALKYEIDRLVALLEQGWAGLQQEL